MKYVLFITLTTAIVGVSAILGALHHPLWFCIAGTGFCVAFLSSFVIKERTERLERLREDVGALTSKYRKLESEFDAISFRFPRLQNTLLAINAELPDSMKIPFNVETPEFGWDPGALQQLETRVRQLMGLFQIIKEMLENVRSPGVHIGAFVYDQLDADASLYRGSVNSWCEFLDPIIRSVQSVVEKMWDIEDERDTFKDGFLDLARQFANLIIHLRTVDAPSFVKASGRGKFASWCAALRMNISYLLVTCVMETGKSMEEFRGMIEKELRSSETGLTFSDIFFSILDRADQVGRFESPRSTDTFLLTPDWARDVRTWVVPERLRRASEPEAPSAVSAWETCPRCASTNMEVSMVGGNFKTTCMVCGHTTHTSLQV